MSSNDSKWIYHPGLTPLRDAPIQAPICQGASRSRSIVPAVEITAGVSDQNIVPAILDDGLLIVYLYLFVIWGASKCGAVRCLSYVYSIHGKIILKNYVCIHRIETMYVYIETMYR